MIYVYCLLKWICLIAGAVIFFFNIPLGSLDHWSLVVVLFALAFFFQREPNGGGPVFK